MKAENAIVLVVEDDDSLREMLLEELTRKHFNTMEASNGRDALELVKKNRIQLVVSDIKMPGGDGIELLKRLREIDPLAPVLIFVSGYCNLLPADAISLGARRFFEKPFDRKEFLKEIQTCIAEMEEPL